MTRLSVILETSLSEEPSDARPEETLGSWAGQDYPRDDVEFILIASDESRNEELFRLLGRFGKKARIIPAGKLDYQHAKLRGIREAWGQITAFGDSDVIYPSNWLSLVCENIDNGHQAVAGPIGFKPGSIFRTMMTLADWGMLSEDGRQFAPYFNACNVAFQSKILRKIDLSLQDRFFRFGGASNLMRQLRRAQIRVRLEQRMRGLHCMNWKVWLVEKRLRRYAHHAFVGQHDPLARKAGHADRPLTWFQTWNRFRRTFQSRPHACQQTLQLGRFDCLFQKLLLAGLSCWEAVLLLYYGVVPGALEKIVKEHEWWHPLKSSTALAA